MTDDFGLWWSDDDVQGRLRRMATAKQAARAIERLCVDRRVCVQAGGHIGLWPRELSIVFERVYTFEPDATNWACLVENVTQANVFAARGVLGEAPGGVRLTRTKAKSGLWTTVPGGPIPTYTVDGLGLDVLDALVLDIEGDELKALKGAEQTIRRDHPVIWFEARTADAAKAMEWLFARGYHPPQRAIGRDVVMQAA